MLLLAVCLVFLLSCTSATGKSRKVYYELGLDNADRIGILAHTGLTTSANFRVFFQTFSHEFENNWKHHCQEGHCLSRPWQISLEETDAKTLFIMLDEVDGKNHTFLVRRFSLENINAVVHFAKQTVRVVIEYLVNLTGKS